MSRRLRALMLVMLASAVMITLVVPSSLAYLIETTATARNTFVMASVLSEVRMPVMVQKTFKSISGEDMSPEGFTFVLTNTNTQEAQTAASDKEGKAEFLLSFCGLDEGVHRFTLHEMNDGRAGVSYDSKVYDIQVRISMNELPEAEVTIDGVVVNGCEVAFENIYDDGSAKIPDTGDHTQLLLWLGLLLISGCSLVVLSARARRKRS